jgi:hypothetical protein
MTFQFDLLEKRDRVLIPKGVPERERKPYAASIHNRRSPPADAKGATQGHCAIVSVVAVS